MCYNSDVSFSENESSCDEGEEVHTYQGPRFTTPEVVAGLSRVVISEPTASSNSSIRHESPSLCSSCQVHLCIDNERRYFEKYHRHVDYFR